MKKKTIPLAILALLGGALLLKSLLAPPKPKVAEEAEAKTAVARIWPLKVIVDATGRVVPEREVEIKCKASGEVVKLPVEVSREVKKGDLLVQLDPGEEGRAVTRQKAVLTAARAKLSAARLQLAMAERDYGSEGGRAKSAETAAAAKAKEADAKLERVTALFDKKMASLEELEGAKSAAAAAAAAWQDAQARVQDVASRKDLSEARRQEVGVAAAEVEAALASLADAEERLAATTIQAPFAGVVAGRNVQVGQIIASGIDNVGGGTPILTLDDLSRTYVLVSVDESDIGKVAEGQPAKITVDAYPDEVFKGEVVQVATRGLSVSNVVTFEVKVEVSGDNRPLLKPEMTANVSIVTKDKLDGLLVPVGALERKKGLSWVTVVKKDGTTDRRLVTIGDSNSEFVEIVKGLEVGETVLIIPEGGQSRWQADRKDKEEQGKKPSARDERLGKFRLLGGGKGK